MYGSVGFEGGWSTARIRSSMSRKKWSTRPCTYSFPWGDGRARKRTASIQVWRLATVNHDWNVGGKSQSRKNQYVCTKKNPVRHTLVPECHLCVWCSCAQLGIHRKRPSSCQLLRSPVPQQIHEFHEPPARCRGGLDFSRQPTFLVFQIYITRRRLGIRRDGR